MPKRPKQGDLRPFVVNVRAVYELKYRVRARTLNGAYAAARAAAEVDNRGATVETAGAREEGKTDD